MKSFIEAYYRVLRMLITVLMGLLIVPVTLQLLSHHAEWISNLTAWTEETARFLFIWIIMIGSMIAVREGSHFDVDLLPRPKTARGKGLAGLVVHLAMVLLAGVFTWYGFEFAKQGFNQNAAMTEINMLWVYAAFPLAGVTWILFLLEKLAGDFRLISETENFESP